MYEETNELELVEIYQESPLPVVVLDPVPSTSVGIPEITDSTCATQPESNYKSDCRE